jgi:hypothetical protein
VRLGVVWSIRYLSVYGVSVEVLEGPEWTGHLIGGVMDRVALADRVRGRCTRGIVPVERSLQPVRYGLAWRPFRAAWIDILRLDISGRSWR